ncbi:hypothetical protein Tco_0146337 [Tanacetum coccineum]
MLKLWTTWRSLNLISHDSLACSVIKCYSFSMNIPKLLRLRRNNRNQSRVALYRNLAIMMLSLIQKEDPNSGVLKKLDRVMSNSAFIDLFGSCYANFLPYVTSDHCPALLVISDVAGMKKHLRSLNKKNGNIYEKVKILIAELKKVQLELDTDPNNAKLREEEMVFCHCLFKNKVDAESALHMIREVSNEEIKVALFDIKDDKAPRPDGFTS